jgi:hypothetical protein
MNRTRLTRLIWSIPAIGVLAMPGSVSAQPEAQQKAAARSAEPAGPKVLILSPAGEPIPALKYRLLPSSADLNPGDAAPIYLRIRHEMSDEGWKQLNEKPYKWLALPLKDFPTAEARQFVDQWSGRLKQIEFGARRKTCEWNYTVPEQRRDVIGILLPDAQSMRVWGRLLALKARVEIAEKRFDDAIETIETSLAFARHTSQGPFAINGLVGIAIAFIMLDRCEELIDQPGAPNLYWALTALPRPLIGMRDQLEVERTHFNNLIPELTEAELAKPRTAAEWSSLLARIHEGLVRWSRFDAPKADPAHAFEDQSKNELSGFKAAVLPKARESLRKSRRMTDDQLGAKTDDQLVALTVADRYREIWDDWFKLTYLPVRDFLPRFTEADRLADAVKGSPFMPFVQLLPSVNSVMMAELRLDRRVAALRVLEAIRINAAEHNGALPESLSQIKAVSVPDDPATGQPFEYHRDGNSATLAGPKAGLTPPWPSYRITIRR